MHYGSSPRAWGLPAADVFADVIHRFIPTRVGFTTTFPSKTPVASGSSPRAWGLRTGPCVPASSSAVHPHARGVYVRHRLPQSS